MKEQIEKVARLVVDNDKIFVVCVTEKNEHQFAVFVDGKEGVTIQKCGEWNRAIRAEIEQKIEKYKDGNFELEVSSYGIGKPLIDERQYAINIGRKAVVSVVEGDEKPKTIEGTLVAISETELTLETIQKKTKQTTFINRKNIKKVHIDVTF